MKNKIPLALLSVLIALGLWLYVVSYVSTEDERTFSDIPVVLENESALEDRGLMLINNQKLSVSLRLHGSRADLNSLTSANIVVSVDLSNIGEAGTHRITASVSYPDGIATSDIQILNRNPEKITVQVVEYGEEEIPVEIVYNGTLPENYNIDKSSVIKSHETVLISGPRENVDQIEKAVIAVDCEGATQSINASYRYTLCDKDGNPVDASNITTDVEEIQVQVPIDHMKEIAVKLAVEPGGGATEDNVSVELSHTAITVAGSQEALDALGDELVLGTVKLETITTSTTQEYQVKLPTGVRNISNVTTITADISLNGLKTVNVPVPDTYFKFINVPEGLDVEAVTRQLDVTVRGPVELVKDITADDLVVTVDLSNTTIGALTMTATVTVKDENSVVGILEKDKYFVNVTLTEIPPVNVEE